MKILFLLAVIPILLLFSCEIKEAHLIDSAKFEFENTIFDSGLDHLDFNGPILKNQIEDFPSNPDCKVYAWWTKYNNDTLWIYARVQKKLKKKTTIHFSKNYIELYDQLTK